MGDDAVAPAEPTEHALTGPAQLTEPAQVTEAAQQTEPAGEAPSRADAGMSWWTRSWVTLGVLIAMGLTAAGILVVRHVLDHTVDPKAVQQRVADRLTSLDPALTGFTPSGTDVTSLVHCTGGASCVSAARPFRPDAKATASSLRDAADAWAGGFGLGSPPAADTDLVRCGPLVSAPALGVLCDLATYQIPGDDGQHVHVYAQLTADAKAPAIGAIGTFTRTQLAKLAVTSAYVQVLGTVA